MGEFHAKCVRSSTLTILVRYKLLNISSIGKSSRACQVSCLFPAKNACQSCIVTTAREARNLLLPSLTNTLDRRNVRSWASTPASPCEKCMPFRGSKSNRVAYEAGTGRENCLLLPDPREEVVFGATVCVGHQSPAHRKINDSRVSCALVLCGALSLAIGVDVDETCLL